MKGRFERFTVLINRISRSIKRLKNQEMAEYGLKGPQVSCLYYLYVTEGLTAKELCQRCEEDKATISRTLEYLEENGYVSCEKTILKKRYKSPLSLTEKGREAGACICERVEALLLRVGGGLSEEERHAFYHSLGIICQNLEGCVKLPATDAE